MTPTATAAPLLDVRGLIKHFPTRKGRVFGSGGAVRAVDGMDFVVREGEILGIVGESGCGKSTMGRLLLRLIDPDRGEVLFNGTNLATLARYQVHAMRRHMQMVFQDPLGSLNPRMRVGQAVAETLRFHGIGTARERLERARAIFGEIGLNRDQFDRLPHELSGGQNQRVGIARAMIIRPKLVVLDEPVSALDVSIRAQILRLLLDMKDQLRLTYVFISHDLGVVKRISDRIAVLYLGKVMEIAEAESLYRAPLHPYTQGLIQAIPVADPRVKRVADLKEISGELPSPSNPPSGCRFHTRCPAVMKVCAEREPPLTTVAPGRQVACFLHSDPGQAPVAPALA